MKERTSANDRRGSQRVENMKEGFVSYGIFVFSVRLDIRKLL